MRQVIKVSGYQGITNEGLCLGAAPIGHVIGVLTALFLVSVLYAIVLEYLERRWGVVTDYTWLSVVIGVGYTLGALALLDWGAARLALMVFAVASVPIIIRSLVNDIMQRHELRRHLEERGNGDCP